jgi:hypothetical protein
MQSAVYAAIGNEEAANNSRAAALEAKEAGAQCLEFLKNKKPPNVETALPFVHFRKGKNHLLAKGSLRLTKFFRQRVYQAIK